MKTINVIASTFGKVEGHILQCGDWKTLSGFFRKLDRIYGEGWERHIGVWDVDGAWVVLRYN